MPNQKPPVWEDIEELINSQKENWRKHNFGVWAVVDKNHQELIGHCGLKFLEYTKEVQIGYLFAKSYWGRGLATEAAEAALKHGFEIAKLDRIVGVSVPENLASRRVMEKVGMQYKRNDYYYNNHVVYYSINSFMYKHRNRAIGRKTELRTTGFLEQDLSPLLMS
jgi:ribosomal-protein-alanine N-acetyltransferase